MSRSCSCVGPSVRFEAARLDFGLLQVGSQTTQWVTVCNTSQYHPAWWTLQQVPQHAQQASSASTEFKFEAQHAQHGMPAALQLKEQQLVQQLHEGQVSSDAHPTKLRTQDGSTDAEASRDEQDAVAASAVQGRTNTADAANPELTAPGADQPGVSPISTADVAAVSEGAAAEAAAEAGHSNPFVAGVEGREQNRSGPKLELVSECGKLEPGASATVQVCCALHAALCMFRLALVPPCMWVVHAVLQCAAPPYQATTLRSQACHMSSLDQSLVKELIS